MSVSVSGRLWLYMLVDCPLKCVHVHECLCFCVYMCGQTLRGVCLRLVLK